MNTAELKHSPAQTETQSAPKAVHSKGLTQSTLKLIAAALMLADHIGFMLLPTVQVLRIIGRLSFPLFAYFVYEGSRYTHSKTRYLLRMLTLGIVCAVVYYIYEGVIYGNVLITFTLSILTLYAVQRLKTSFHSGTRKDIAVSAALAAGCVAFDYVLCLAIEVDYGFFGVMLPVLAEVFTPPTGMYNVQCAVYNDGGGQSSRYSATDSACDSDAATRNKIALEKKIPIRKLAPLIGFAAALVCLCVQWGGIQWFSLGSLVLLLLYNGERGRTGKAIQYFFYLFYPVHLAVLGVVAALL